MPFPAITAVVNDQLQQNWEKGFIYFLERKDELVYIVAAISINISNYFYWETIVKWAISTVDMSKGLKNLCDSPHTHFEFKLQSKRYFIFSKYPSYMFKSPFL